MSFTIITSWDENRVTKFQSGFTSRKEAEAYVEKHSLRETFPKLFITKTPTKEGVWTVSPKGGLKVVSPKIEVHDIAAERDRRLNIPYTYHFLSDKEDLVLSITDKAMKGWDEVDKYAQAIYNVENDKHDSIRVFAENREAYLTVEEWFDVSYKIRLRRQEIIQGYLALKRMDSIPPDYTKDLYWS